MRRLRFLFSALVAATFGAASLASQAPSPGVEDLVGTWTLQSMEQRLDTGKPSRAGTPRGLLVFDRGGHAAEEPNRAGTAHRAALKLQVECLTMGPP